jgi:putative PIN family toxin of toxin-antitoxin system
MLACRYGITDDTISCVKVVLDTNVLYAALRSNRGASYQVLRRVGTQSFQIAVSVGAILEYEEVLKAHAPEFQLSASEIDDVLDYLCSVAELTEVFFLWRPQLTDPDDDMLLELAVAAGCDAIVTFNVRDFLGTEQFGIRVLTPRAFLLELEP